MQRPRLPILRLPGFRARPGRGPAAPLRLRIAAAFAVMSAITIVLGLFAIRSVERSGGIVVDIFGHALIATSYARAAATDFAGMDATLGRWRLAAPADRPAIAGRLAELAALAAQDLDIAAERATTASVRNAVATARRAVEAWLAAAERGYAAAAPDWAALDELAADAHEALDVLVNLYAADAFRQRQQAQRAVVETEWMVAAGVGAALLLGMLVAALLTRRIIGPVAAASTAAVQIAAGELDTPIPPGGRDELGRLLRAMETMRNAIRATIAGEQAERRSAQARLLDAMEGSTEGVVLVDAAGGVLAANARATALLPGPGEGPRPGADWPSVLAARLGAEAARITPPPSVVELRRDDGAWLRLSASPARDGGAVAILSDISDLKAKEEALSAANDRFSAALANMSQGLCMVGSDGRVVICNARFAEMFGLAGPEEAAARPVRDVFAAIVGAGTFPANLIGSIEAEQVALGEAGRAQEFLRQGPSGEAIGVAQVPLQGGGWLATYEDLTEKRRAEEQIAFLAHHDPLTGLPNRVRLRDRADRAIAELGRGRGFAVLCLDLDRFRTVNETLGHAAGDQLLRAVADRLAACCREVDTLARLGADAFTILQAAVESPQGVEVLGRRILDAMAEPFELAGQRIVVGISIGIARAPQDGAQMERLMRAADTALYRAKQDGGGVLRFFEPGMDAQIEARRALEIDLRRAVAEEQLDLFYQPQVALGAGRVSGFEALIRWRHPERGMVSPGEFVPLAEETGLIIPIGEWALRRACRDAMAWPDDVRVAVNVSPLQFRSPRLVQAVAEALAASGLPPERLEVEITESVMLQDNAATIATLHQMRDLGARIAMDDFGTGYSSLSYLRSFPFDKIKIDQSFIRDLAKGAAAQAIVRAITVLGLSLGMRTTAEGVETAEQLDRLRAEGCTEVQGYFFGKPGPAAEVPDAVARINARLRETT